MTFQGMKLIGTTSPMKGDSRDGTEVLEMTFKK
jgi:hypothetical protein